MRFLEEIHCYWENDLPNGAGILTYFKNVEYLKETRYEANFVDAMVDGSVNYFHIWFPSNHLPDGNNDDTCTATFNAQNGVADTDELPCSECGLQYLRIKMQSNPIGVPPWADVYTNPEVPAPAGNGSTPPSNPETSTESDDGTYSGIDDADIPRFLRGLTYQGTLDSAKLTASDNSAFQHLLVLSFKNATEIDFVILREFLWSHNLIEGSDEEMSYLFELRTGGQVSIKMVGDLLTVTAYYNDADLD